MTIKQFATLQALEAKSKEQASQIPNAIENALVKQFEQDGRRFSTLKQDMQNASLQHARAMQRDMQQIVRILFAVGIGRLLQHDTYWWLDGKHYGSSTRDHTKAKSYPISLWGGASIAVYTARLGTSVSPTLHMPHFNQV